MIAIEAFRNRKVAAPLKLHGLPIYSAVAFAFRNRKVAAPLRLPSN